MAAVTEPRWTGWHRPRNGAWQKVVSDAPSAADCWGELLAAVAGLPSGDPDGPGELPPPRRAGPAVPSKRPPAAVMATP